jgi:hypothetical protein
MGQADGPLCRAIIDWLADDRFRQRVHWAALCLMESSVAQRQVLYYIDGVEYIRFDTITIVVDSVDLRRRFDTSGRSP